LDPPPSGNPPPWDANGTEDDEAAVAVAESLPEVALTTP
jgi:hypothetical protein